jgi:hypothetical protein
MPRPFEPQSLDSYGSADLRAPLGVGAVCWRYTLLIPFEEVASTADRRSLATDADLESVATVLCRHFGGLSILPPMDGLGSARPSRQGND